MGEKVKEVRDPEGKLLRHDVAKTVRNLVEFCRNDPVNGVDPLGEKFWGQGGTFDRFMTWATGMDRFGYGVQRALIVARTGEDPGPMPRECLRPAVWGPTRLQQLSPELGGVDEVVNQSWWFEEHYSGWVAEMQRQIHANAQEAILHSSKTGNRESTIRLPNLNVLIKPVYGGSPPKIRLSTVNPRSRTEGSNETLHGDEGQGAVSADQRLGHFTFAVVRDMAVTWESDGRCSYDVVLLVLDNCGMNQLSEEEVAELERAQIAFDELSVEDWMNQSRLGRKVIDTLARYRLVERARWHVRGSISTTGALVISR